MFSIADKYEAVGNHLLPAIGYGDAVGLPYETGDQLPAGQVQGMVPVENDYLGQFPAGTWSDDTQLSLAVTESLLDRNGFDIEDQADKHVQAYRHSLGELALQDWVPPMVDSSRALGWGGSTAKSMQRLMKGFSPISSGAPEGAGNGVLMKLAPLVYWQRVTRTPVAKTTAELVDITHMTHQAPEAVVSTLVHAQVLRELLGVMPDEHDDLTAVKRSIIASSARLATIYEQQMDVPPVTSQLLGRLSWLARRGSLSSDSINGLAPAHGFYAPETLAMAYGSFMRESTFPDSVYRAVELGGDSDSVASVVASMSTFLHGKVDAPHDIEWLYDVPRLKRVSRQLAQTALGNAGLLTQLA